MGKGVGLRLLADYSKIPVSTLQVFLEEGRTLSRKDPSTLTDGESLLVALFDATKNEARLVGKAFAVIDAALEVNHLEGVRLARWVVEQYAQRGLAFAEIEARTRNEDPNTPNKS